MKINTRFAFVSFLTASILSPVLGMAADEKSQSSPPPSASNPSTQLPNTASPFDLKRVDPEAPPPMDATTQPAKVDVQAMKKRYWTVGNEDLMDVVQNRLYVKKHRVEVAFRLGSPSDDPFESMSSLGLSVGYHFNEFFSLHGFYASISAKPSQASIDYTDKIHTAPVVNPTSKAMGVEGRGSLLYGKLSLLGKSIIYYDFNVAAGLTQVKTASGNNTGIIAGMGQQVYISRVTFVTVDYRVIFRSEAFAAGTRSVTTNWVQFGVGAFLF